VTRGRAVGRWLLAVLQFVPLSLFAAHAFARDAHPAPERWMEAYLLGAGAAAVQLAITVPRREPLDRLMLGANAYLLVGGLASLLGLWRVLLFYRAIQEAGIFAAMLLVGVVTTLWTRPGFVGVPHAEAGRVRRASLILLALTAGALGVTIAFPGGRRLGVTLLLLALIAAHRVLARRLRAAGA
jgi:hypothetical protein